MYRRFFKRLIDILIALIGFAVLIIPMLIVSVIIKIDTPGPVLFRQKRVGLGKSYFTIVKFRSMPVQAPHDTPTHQFRHSDTLLSPWQKFMRKASVDELPQLWNILCGQMSIVGPRPALWNQYDLIEERDKYGANGIRPGLTGWAQINGRDELKINEKARLDGEYGERLSFGFDLKCFWGTIGYVLRHKGVVEGVGTIAAESSPEEKTEVVIE